MYPEREFLISAYDIPYEDHDDEVLKEKYSYQDIKNLINVAKKENLLFLSSISFHSKTYFNERQTLAIIRNEIPILKNKNINTHLLDNIVQIGAFVLDGYSFLKFEPIANSSSKPIFS